MKCHVYQGRPRRWQKRELGLEAADRRQCLGDGNGERLLHVAQHWQGGDEEEVPLWWELVGELQVVVSLRVAQEFLEFLFVDETVEVLSVLYQEVCVAWYDGFVPG